MRILLINANQEKWPIPAAPIGLSLVAASLRKARHDLRLIDRMFLFSKEQEESIFSAAIRQFKPELIGLSIRNIDNTCMAGTRYYLPAIKNVVAFLKSLTDVPFVIGGAGYSLFPKETLQYLDVDFGIIGEGEVAGVQLANALQKGSSLEHIPGSIQKRNSDFQLKLPSLIPNLDELEPAAFNLLDYQKYIQKKSYIGIQTKRGCAFKCIFCEYPRIDGKTCRLKSPGKVVDEIVEVQKYWNLDYFFFVDSVFNFPVEHAVSICEEIIKRNVQIKWYANVNPVGISNEMADIMARSGCVGVDVGIDVASEKMLVSMAKGFSQADIEQASKCYRHAGIATSFQLLLGGPGETRETLKETLTFMETIPQPDNVLTIFGIRIYPDAPLYAIAKEEDIVFQGKRGNYLSPTFYLSHNLMRLIARWLKIGAGDIRIGQHLSIPGNILKSCGQHVCQSLEDLKWLPKIYSVN